jgi:hypothetical protein
MPSTKQIREARAAAYCLKYAEGRRDRLEGKPMNPAANGAYLDGWNSVKDKAQ